MVAGRLMLALSLVAVLTAAADLPYAWKNVQIVGGGFVDGFVFHPSEAGLRYARTDMGGAYRWDEAAGRWQPILDWVSYRDANLMGVESIAIDPADPDRVYLACGTYTGPEAEKGAILRSTDRGRSFERIDMPVKFGGNENGRGNGERLKVDPKDGNILFLGTRHDGLWTSSDAGRHWRRVDSFPLAEDRELSGWRQAGIVFALFAPGSNDLVVGQSVSGQETLFVSGDLGAHWRAIAGQPTGLRPTRAAFGPDGVLYVAYGSSPGPSPMSGGAVWKYQDGIWTDITPEKGKFGYAAVAADSRRPGVLIASSFGRPGGEDIFRSLDGGSSWRPVFGSGGLYDPTLAPYVAPTAIHWLFDIEIDPLNSAHALFSTGYGGWETDDLTALDDGKATHWHVASLGIEETVGLKLLSPTAGPPLVSGIGDYGGFVHRDLDRPAPEGAMAPPRLSDTTGLDAASRNPAIMVRVGAPDFNRRNPTLGFTLDGGQHWSAPPVLPEPDAAGGQVAVSADGADWLWVPRSGKAWITSDRGAHWTAADGIAPRSRILADPEAEETFYALSPKEGKIFTSHDRGRHFTGHPLSLARPLSLAGDVRGGQGQLYAAPGRPGELWLTSANGLYRSADGGAHFTLLPEIDELHAFGLGKSAPGGAWPALYLAGTVRGRDGIFRSDDGGRDWRRINDDAHRWGLVLQLAGDPKRYGRVYIGTHGRGILYGDPP